MAFLTSIKRQLCPPVASTSTSPPSHNMHHHRRAKSAPTATTATASSSASELKLASISADTLAIKLRNQSTDPPTTKTFTLPRARAILTSSYFRDHVTDDFPSKHHKDGIIRLNFPDFEIFAIYVEWLHSGEIFTKASLAQLQQSPSKTGQSSERIALERKARAAYTDYLGLFFLSTWLRDIVFKDTLTSLIISKANLPDGAGYPDMFVKALKPSLVDLVCTGEEGSRGMRRLMYSAIARWGGWEDVERLVPREERTAERGFVRGLLGFLLEGQSDRQSGKQRGGGENKARERREDGWGNEEDEVASVWENVARTEEEEGALVKRQITQWSPPTQPPPFMPSKMEDLWEAASHVSWPTTTSGAASEASGLSKTTATLVLDHHGRRSVDFGGYVKWPEKEEDHCAFHEHTYLGLPCHRKTARWDVDEQRMMYGT